MYDGKGKLSQKKVFDNYEELNQIIMSWYLFGQKLDSQYEYRYNNNGKGKVRWVVKCRCSRYSIRTYKAIFSVNNQKDCCSECYNLRIIKSKEYYKLTGKAKSPNFFC